MALKGIKVIEMAGLAPAPFCGMLLRDFGASVIRVDKMKPDEDIDRMARGKRSIVLNLKTNEGVRVLKSLANLSDVLIEPYRPGVMESLGLGPSILMKDNPRLIFARLTGYGQTGTLADRAGHDINYLAISGILSRLGRAHEKPTAPVNLLADFAGGGLLCAFGILVALLERKESGLGQVIDHSMVEGSAYISTFLHRSRDLIFMSEGRGKNALDGGWHLYDTYETKDGKYMAVGALEPQFYVQFCSKLGFSLEELPLLGDFDELKRKVTEQFLTKSQDEWTSIFEHTDSCVTPVIEMEKAHLHQHNKDRGSFQIGSRNVYEARPTPVLSRTPGKASVNEPKVGEHSVQILKELNYSDGEIEQLLQTHVVGALQAKL